MKRFGIAVILALGLLVLAACGGGNSPNSPATAAGSWTATLMNTDGTPAFGFTISLTQNAGTLMVTGSNLSFKTSTDCFTSGGTQTGSFVVNQSVNGNVTGAFELTIMSGT